jgi:hypothetical protein
MNLPAETTATDDELNHAWGKREEVISRAELSALYHQKRERFFELFDKLGKAIAIFGGSAALWKITDSHLVAYLAAGITASSALSLVFSFSERSKRHAELARGFRELIGDVVSAGDFDISDKQASKWMAQIYALDAKEPPALSALVVMCQNELAFARKAEVYPQSFLVRCLAHFFDLPRTA